MLSTRSRFGSTENPLARAVSEARREGRTLLDLTVGNPTHVGLSPSNDSILEALAASPLDRYDPAPLGAKSTREAAAAVLGVSPRAVVVTASTSEAYALLFKLLCDPGDRILVPSPSYPLLDVLAALESVVASRYALRYDGEWHLDPAELTTALNERASAIVSVSPNNPTGSYLKRDELDRLLDTGLPLIIDEVFHPYVLEGDPPERLEVQRGLVFRLSGLSKIAALPQMKLGFFAVEGDPALVDEALRRLEHMNDAYLSAGGPVQSAASRLLSLGDAARRVILDRCRANLRSLDLAFEAFPEATRTRVEGGWYVPIRLPRVLTEEQWALTLLDAGVVTQPGWFYDFEDEAWLVLSLIADEPVFRQGVERLVEKARSVVEAT